MSGNASGDTQKDTIVTWRRV